MAIDHLLASGPESLVGTEQSQVPRLAFGVCPTSGSIRLRALLVLSSRPLFHWQPNQASVSMSVKGSRTRRNRERHSMLCVSHVGIRSYSAVCGAVRSYKKHKRLPSPQSHVVTPVSIRALLDAEERHPLSCLVDCRLQFPVVLCQPPILALDPIRRPKGLDQPLPPCPPRAERQHGQRIGMPVEHDKRRIARKRFVNLCKSPVEILQTLVQSQRRGLAHRCRDVRLAIP